MIPLPENCRLKKIAVCKFFEFEIQIVGLTCLATAKICQIKFASCIHHHHCCRTENNTRKPLGCIQYWFFALVGEEEDMAGVYSGILSPALFPIVALLFLFLGLGAFGLFVM
jgi:hypothetical protein